MASQTSIEYNRYIRPTRASAIYLALDNIAVLTETTFPLVGNRETVNSTFVEQTYLNAKAPIDYLSEAGIIDKDKVVIFGHSFGAFAVVNLLAHKDIFAGGIANSGAYNRTLTPFGFQTERQTLWEARDTYLNMSPFLYANQINKPLLLVHGTHDINVGTFPIQSIRLYEALEGLGKQCRFVKLPFEAHSYKSSEANLHILWEYKKFFDDYIK